MNKIIRDNQNSEKIIIIFDYKGEKNEMRFNYGTSVGMALAQYTNEKSFSMLYPKSFYFIYKFSKINALNSQKIEEFFEKNEANYVIVMDNAFNFDNPINQHLAG